MNSAVSPRSRKSRTIWTSPSKRWSAHWRSHSPHLSLDAPITPGEDHRLLDYLPDQYAPAPEDEAYDHALKGQCGECAFFAEGTGGPRFFGCTSAWTISSR